MAFAKNLGGLSSQERGTTETMMAKLKIIAAPLLMAGAAAGWLAAAPYAVADAYAAAAGTSITQFAPQSPGGDGCANGVCGSGDAGGGSGCTAEGVCGS